jgi:hypothetical protein
VASSEPGSRFHEAITAAFDVHVALCHSRLAGAGTTFHLHRSLAHIKATAASV